ncbi:MAG: hypothetical protein HRT37_24405 [Alteromonadaceae bacterium]|nr:hypothetical protein [Alteromonadaceae bacterium]
MTVEQMHDLSINNKLTIQNTKCACFYCLKTFDGSDVVRFIDNGNTARCPACGTDAVLPRIVDIDTLKELHKHYF